MTPLVARARDRALDAAARLGALIRRHPLRSVLALPALVLLYALLLLPFTPSTTELRKARAEVPSTVVAADGAVLAEFRRLNREWVPLDRISPNVIDALIATEDHRFYDHHGIDWRRVLAAAWSTLQGDLQGGSTITQQLARNLYPEEIGRSPTIHRKLKEALTALKLEAVYSKTEILEAYLNTVPFLYNAFGIEMAARTYFDKSARQLNVVEGATLIGMLKGTSYYNPVQNPERAKQRRNFVMAQMVRHGKLPAERAQALSKQPLRLDFERQTVQLGPAPHVAQWVRKWLIDWADQRGYDIHADGLVVRTTLHMRLQKAAQQALARQVAQLQAHADRRVKKGEESQPLQAGFLALDPRTGHVKAWVGSPDFQRTPFDYVSQARRQPGSTFKPFVYGAAFEQGFQPGDTFMDEPVSIRAGGGPVWTPSDGGGPSYQPMTLREGLVHSKNTITAQLVMQVGPAQVARLARGLGVRESKLEEVPSLALGTSPVTLREMIAAYGSIANGGSYIEPVLVTRIENRRGEVLQAFAEAAPQPAMSRAQSLKLVDVMRGVVDEGTGRAIRTRHGIDADVAGKTGTTQDNSDGWFILMHPQLVAGAWVGFNDRRATMGDGWGQGARSALPIVGNVFQQALRYRWIDARAEFDIPRWRPQPPEGVHGPPGPQGPDPVQQLINDVIGRLFRVLQ